MNNPLSNFIKSTPGNKFQIDINSDDKLDRLSAAPTSKPNITKPKPGSGTYLPKYRLMRRQDEIILQQSQILEGNLIWVDIPTVEDEQSEMA